MTFIYIYIFNHHRLEEHVFVAFRHAQTAFITLAPGRCRAFRHFLDTLTLRVGRVSRSISAAFSLPPISRAARRAMAYQRNICDVAPTEDAEASFSHEFLDAAGA